MRTIIAAALLLGTSALALPGMAAAAGGGGGGGGDGARTSAPVKPEDPQYGQGVKAIKAGKFAEAITLLDGVVARDNTNADAYNWLAYATRKNGDPAKAIPIYEKALTLDPKHRGAHEYIGEAYLMVKDLARAQQHLAALESICLLPCEELSDLKDKIAAYRSGAR